MALKSFKATHIIINPLAEGKERLPYDESECLLMAYGGFFCTRQVWEEGGHYIAEWEVTKAGYEIHKLED